MWFVNDIGSVAGHGLGAEILARSLISIKAITLSGLKICYHKLEDRA
jgi:hypothetical protein